MRNSRENNPRRTPDVEYNFDMTEQKEKLEALHHRQMHKRFGIEVNDSVNGRPRKLSAWLGGVLSRLGCRRP